MTTLRPYQRAHNDAIAAALAAGQRRILTKMPTGTGKTVCFAELVRDLTPWMEAQGLATDDRKMLVIAHREELLDQAARKIRAANPGLMVAIEQADRHASPYADVVVASIQTLAARKFQRLHRFTSQTTFRLVIVDECFPPGTLVDGRPIERIRVDDYVTAFDPLTGLISPRRVIRALTKRAIALVRIHTDRGVLACTPRHKLWTMNGWTRAEDIVAGCMIGHHADANRGQVPRLSRASDAHPEVIDRFVASVGPDVLLRRAQRSVGSKGVLAPDGGDESAVRLGTDEETQSHARRSVAGQDALIAQSVEAQADCPGRQWSTHPCSATPAGRSPGMANRGNRTDRGWVPPSSLQTRHRESSPTHRDRGRRFQSLRSARSGLSQGRVVAWARVDRVAILEPDSDGEFERLCPGGLVYDLEVEGLHTYFADGFAVSNCHHAAAPTYRTALVHLGFLPPADASDRTETESADGADIEAMTRALAGWDAIAPTDRVLVGVTATPNRSDAIGLGCVFQAMPYSYALRQAIEDGWLVPIVPWAVETTTSLEAVKTSHGEFHQGELAATVNTEARNRLAVAAWGEHAKGRATIAFTVDVAHAHALAAAFSGAGLRARAVSAETPTEERRATLAAFEAGHLDVITNCAVLTEGTDLPIASCILHAKPTKSATLYEQMSGRGLRLYPGKETCVLIDLVDVTRKHTLQAAASLYGLPPRLLLKGQTLSQAADAVDALLGQGVRVSDALGAGPMTLAQLQARAVRVDPWAIAALGAFGDGRAMNWIKVAEDEFRLQYPWADGTETLRVRQTLIGQWEVLSTLRFADRMKPTQAAVLVRDAPSAAAAGDIAEQFIRRARPTVERLKARDAGWRGKPASEKQRALLSRKRIPIPPGCTMGQASDLIDLAMSRGRA